MKYIFFGTPHFASIILENLLKKGLIPAAIITNPDKPVGRNKIITSPETKTLLLNHPEFQIKIFQPEKITPEFAEELKALNPDLFIIAAYAKIIPQYILDIPKLGALGIHPSLLPKYRGSSPMQGAILNGEKESGVSIFMVDAKMDHGPIIATQKINIENQTYLQAQEHLAHIGADLLTLALPKFLNNQIIPQEQDHNQATFTQKFSTQDGFIDVKDIEIAKIQGGQIAQNIYHKILALNPEPGTWTLTNSLSSQVSFSQEKRIKIIESKLDNDKKLIITKIQVEGKNPMILKEN